MGSNQVMALSRLGLILFLASSVLMLHAQAAPANNPSGGRSIAIQPEAWQIVVLANQARAAQRTAPLRWDPALAAAARRHCLRMASEGPISHRYAGELDVSERAGQAGAHFSLIEENVAIGPTPSAIHDEWMHSPGHRTNLLNPEVDSIGVAVVASRGVLYAVADYESAVQVLTEVQVEAAIARLLRAKGVALSSASTDARSYCAQNRGAKLSNQPGFRMLWQDADVARLPSQLLNKIASRQYRQAAVGSCPAQGVEGQFTVYRVAVLLY
jgi:uncharacterized protein YkwD